MRILMLNHNQEKFGTYWRCYSLAEGLSKLGHNLIMICASGKKFDLRIKKQRINDCFIIYTLPRIKLFRYFSGQFILRLPLYLYFTLFTKYDLLYAFTVAQTQIGFPALLGKILRRKKLIIDWDDLWGGGFADMHFKPIKLILTFSEVYFLRFADFVTCASQGLFQKAIKVKNKEKVFYLPNGCDSNRIKMIPKEKSRKKLGFSEKDKIVLVMGNAYHLTVLDFLLSTYLTLVKKIPEIKFIFLSSSEIPEGIKLKFKEVFDRVIFYGFVTGEQRDLYLSSAGVLVLPMNNNPIEEARSPIRFGDYLCAGRPIVSNAVGEVKYYLEKFEAGLTCSPNSIRGFADGIEKVLKNKKLADKISQNARKLSETELSEVKVVEKLNRFL